MSPTRPGRRLLVVAVVIALALAGAGAALAWQGYRDARAAELEEVADAARASAADISQYLAGRSELLMAVATTEGILEDRPATVGRRLGNLARGRLGFTAGVVWFDPSNEVRASVGAAATGTATDRGLRGALLRARSDEQPFVSGGVPATIFAVPAVVVAVPTRDAGGAINGALAAVGTSGVVILAPLGSSPMGSTVPDHMSSRSCPLPRFVTDARHRTAAGALP